MSLRFTEADCTQEKIDNANTIYHNSRFACLPSPYGGNECIATTNQGEYSATLQGCRDCVSNCGSKQDGGNGDKKPPKTVDSQNSSKKEMSTPAKVALWGGGAVGIIAIIVMFIFFLKK